MDAYKMCKTELKIYYEPFVGNFVVPMEDWKEEFKEDVERILKADHDYYFCAWNDGERDYWCLSNLE